MGEEETFAVNLGGSTKVVGLSVDEDTGLHVVDGHGNVEGGVGGKGSVTVGREDELGGGHGVEVGDLANGAGVARTLLELLSVGDLTLSKTEVDEVVGGGQRLGLTISRSLLASESEALGNDGGVEG